ncbi:hypothetical protein SUGI_0958320 [Cryptomeria japonica]|nr:hypothetical protein SUGI_0958320 [Cryptomeria japonica]
MKAVHKVFDAFADKLIDEHVERKRRKKSEEPDIVVVMLDMAESENPEIDVSRIHIKAIILDMLTAATEASATTVEWAMTEPLLVPHESTQGCNVGGYYIPPKTRKGCPGIPMGFSVVELVVAQLMLCFHWTVEGDVDRDEVFGLSVPRKFPLSSLPSWRLTTNEPP